MSRRCWPHAAVVGLYFSIFLTGCGRSVPAEEPTEHQAQTDNHAAVIHVVQSTQQALKIAVVPAEVKVLEQILQVTGQIAQDTDRLVHVDAPAAGTLTKFLVAIGQRVDQGTPLAIVQPNKGEDPIQIVAPRDGLILGLHIAAGSQIDTLTSLMTIADLSQVWSTFDLYEQDVALVQVGQRIEAHSVAYPGRIFTGKVVFVSPQVDQHTRTIKARAQIENPDYALKLGMFVTGTLYIPSTEETVVVPHEAVQRMENKRVVFVQTGPESFEPRQVQVGRETRSGVQILEGLNAGDTVVASGSFHLKGELLKGTLGEED